MLTGKVSEVYVKVELVKCNSLQVKVRTKVTK